MRIFTVILLFLSVDSYAQKQDYHWFFGSDQSAEPGVQGIEFDFNQIPILPTKRDGGLEFDQNNASISDAEGNLLFYSNGCAIANKEHEVMENGDSINQGFFFEQLWLNDCGNGYPGRQDIIILDDPGNPTGYYMIHKPVEFEPMSSPSVFVNFINYSYVDLAANNGLGTVLDKNIELSNKKIQWSYLTAIHQANGEDWWILQPADTANLYYRYQITSAGIEELDPQIIDRSWIVNSSASGGARFSPDGKTYAYYNKYNGLNLYDYDRTTGMLSNWRLLEKEFVGSGLFSTVEYSPNSRFVYIATVDSLWQVDTWEADLKDGEELVGLWNGIPDPFPTAFFSSILGPDCRIYIRGGSSQNNFHVVKFPDEKGTACEFQQMVIPLPYVSSTGSFPNFPRWRVDEAEKCNPDIASMFQEPVYYTRDLTIFPNPVEDWLYVNIPEAYPDGELMVYDTQGKVMLHLGGAGEVAPFVAGQFSLEVSEWGKGTYFVEYLPRDRAERVMYVGKLVKI